MNNDLRVEKKQEKVSLFMADGLVLEATVFLAQYRAHRSGEQTVLDLVLEEDPFLPAKAASGEFHLVRKGMISHLRCPIELDPDLEYSERQVKISFLGGEILQGVVRMNLPSHAARLTDYINQGAEFFPLFSGENAYLVNRNLVRDLVLVD